MLSALVAAAAISGWICSLAYAGRGAGEVACDGPEGEERCGIVVSDRAVKADFATVDARAVLARVAALPIQS